MAGNSNLNHCQQVEALRIIIERSVNGLLVRVAKLDKKLAKTLTKAFMTMIDPRLDELTDTGQRMEDGLFIRKTIMQLSNDYLEFTDLKGKTFIVKGKGNLEEYYQTEKPKLKERLAKKRL